MTSIDNEPVAGVVTVMTDQSSRPAPPQSKFKIDTPQRNPTSLTVACQVLLIVNVVAALAAHVAWIGSNRTISEGLRHVALLRSYSVADFGPNAGGGSGFAEFLVVVAFIAMVVIGVASTKAFRSLDLVCLAAWTMAVALLVVGLLRLGASSMNDGHAWIGRVVWIVTVLLAVLGGRRVLAAASPDRSKRYDAVVCVVIVGIAAAVPLMISLGLWASRSISPVLANIHSSDHAPKSVKPWLYAAGVAPLLMICGLLFVRPPLTRRFSIGFGTLLFATSLIFVGKIIPGRLDRATARIGKGESSANTAAAQSTIAPIPPCVVWKFDGNKQLVVQGDPCVNIAIIEGSTTQATVTLPTAADDIGAVADPMLSRSTQKVTGQVYAGVAVMVERDSTSGTVAVVARSTTDLRRVWTQSCASPGVPLSVHFSGGLIDRDPAANRTDFDVYGVIDYVAILCNGILRLYNPVTGAVLS